MDSANELKQQQTLFGDPYRFPNLAHADLWRALDDARVLYPALEDVFRNHFLPERDHDMAAGQSATKVENGGLLMYRQHHPN